ncbi:5-methyltetrahydropteroyltriglutamate--homocysteine S-methyltransferase [Catenovulum sediminis]|uniref:5-methyltetrahydropteroyltriglutamate-- homocysteine S-methyltransferase n=1 Tax=Catenovulum sediminis TaxID=1740262 RepID=UPI00117EA039|nr:5-methyltetrahydropteroyltriglutamate--homocysteine S-methyltransferase [Catenovulum sediminis]
MKIHNLGLPRIGEKRELKFALEAYWDKKISLDELTQKTDALREQTWAWQLAAGLDFITVGDFPLYDQVLDTSILFSAIPQRFQHLSELDQQFAIARGDTCCQHAASDMTKWFNTNYHYIVPELDSETEFSLNAEKLLNEVAAAQTFLKSQNAKQQLKLKLIGPVSYLWLAKINNLNQLDDLLTPLLACYRELFKKIAATGIEWIQIEEPILTTEPESHWQNALRLSYAYLNQKRSVKLLLTTYFADVDEHIELINSLAVDGVHIDAVAGQPKLDDWLVKLNSEKVLSVGVIDGRNIWRSDLAAKLKSLQTIYDRKADNLWIAPSCSLQHVPVDLELETKLQQPVRSWLAFAKQKLVELNILKSALVDYEVDPVIAYSKPVTERLNSDLTLNVSLRQQIQALGFEHTQRDNEYNQRKIAQKSLNLPLLPTTTIGSFPQTAQVRHVRARFKRGEISETEYQSYIKAYIADAIAKQLEAGLDVLVHGEPERNDMVEFFGEQLDGFAITQYAWVQSYGSRCVKPPIIYGDIERKQAITVDTTQYAQSLTDKPVKGMLTGPVTILNWSFVRDDLSRQSVAKQIAFALRGEVSDLEAAGIKIIQVDEPAIREGLPLKKAHWQNYLGWAVEVFRIATSCVKDATQIHTHMCYSEFQDIVGAISALDADVISVEAARSDMSLLKPFAKPNYQNEIGLGVYDIHSPIVPNVEDLQAKIELSLNYIEIEQCWVNPDCGLKTRKWEEVLPALNNLVKAAEQVRAELTPAGHSGKALFEVS